MAESVDALVSNTSGAIRAGSTPALGTTIFLEVLVNQVFTGAFCFVGCQRVAKNKKYLIFHPLQVAKEYNKSGVALPPASLQRYRHPHQTKI